MSAWVRHYGSGKVKAIVTGATGFLGGHVVSHLLNQGWQVIALGRNTTAGAKLSQQGAIFKVADIVDLQALQAVFESADVIFHCAALSSAWGKYDDFYRVNVIGTRNILSCSQQHNINRIVHVSSTSVYFNFSDRFDIHENGELSKGFANSYAETKYLSEQVLLDENSADTEVVIIRPRGIIGEGDTAIMPRIMKIAQKGWFPLLNSGSALVDITYVKNVAHAMLLAAQAESKKVNGQCINISNQQPLTVKALLTKVSHHHSGSINLIPIPYFILDSIAFFLEKTSQLFNLDEPILTRYGLGLLRFSQTLNTDKAQTLLAYKPIYTLDQAIERYFIDYD